MGGRGYRKHHTKVVWPGFTHTPETRHLAKVGRNEHCPCGSGKKYKDCHEEEGEAYLKGLAFDKEKERLRLLRQEMKDRGVPWYRRIFIRP